MNLAPFIGTFSTKTKLLIKHMDIPFFKPLIKGNFAIKIFG
jgi:hypothetical protein